MQPKISIIGPSHRTYLWRPFYESIVTNLDFEVIFVTDILPDKSHIPLDGSGERIMHDAHYGTHTQHKDFRWIHSPVKPAQCWELAYRQSTGDFIVWSADDFIYAPYALDHAYAMYRSFHDHKVMISFDVYEDGHEATLSYHKVPWDEKTQLTTSALISKQAITEVGGLADINFQAGHWDVDLQMRIYSNGGRMFVCPSALAFEPHNAFHKKEANLATTWAEELEYFTKCWKLPDGTTSKQRLKPFIPYSDLNLLSVNQGKIGGHWT
jgi:hypothetical protein